ncbi:AMP-binding protein [Maribacter algicola]|uniref:AMP-binding protein n=1 Tax=Meishania litoralis TaxID=3434685 RepID=A0ACC7LKN1_9FLAO
MTNEIHPQFKLNGIHFSKEGLKEVGYSLVKEGDPYEHAIGDFLLDWCNETPHISVRTSGSTGKPKQILLKKQHMVNSALATSKFFGLRPGDKALHCLPAEFIAGKMMLVRAMVLGLELDYLQPSSNPLELLSKRYDFCAMVPIQVANSLKKLNNIKTLIVGGAPISNALRTKLRSVDCEIYETYGMTETITHIAARKMGNIRSTEADAHFKVLPEINISQDKRSCLIIDAPHICEEIIMTNDVVRLISKNEFEWLGRYDNIINSGGIKLFPEQIESKLEETIPKPFFVTGLPDEDLGEKLVLIVEGVHDTQKLDRKLKELSNLEKFEVPKEIYGVPEFVFTPNNKIARKKTVQIALDRM